MALRVGASERSEMADKQECKEHWHVFLVDGQCINMVCHFVVIAGDLITFRDEAGEIIGVFSLNTIAGATQVSTITYYSNDIPA